MPLPLLPLSHHCVLPPGPVTAPFPTAAASPSVSVPADVSRDGPFDAQLATSTSGDVPLVLNSLLGCPYRMTSYDRAELVDVDPVYGLQLHHPRFLVYAGDSSLMDGTTELPQLLLPLLPLSDHCVLPPGPVTAPFPTAAASGTLGAYHGA